MAEPVMKTQTYQVGHVLFRQGDIAQNCFLIKSGEIRLSRAEAGGTPMNFATIKKGEILGEMSMIGDTPRTATATISKDAELAEINREDFEAQLEHLNPFMRRLIRLIVQRLRDTTSSLVRS